MVEPRARGNERNTRKEDQLPHTQIRNPSGRTFPSYNEKPRNPNEQEREIGHDIPEIPDAQDFPLVGEHMVGRILREGRRKKGNAQGPEYEPENEAQLRYKLWIILHSVVFEAPNSSGELCLERAAWRAST